MIPVKTYLLKYKKLLIKCNNTLNVYGKLKLNCD